MFSSYYLLSKEKPVVRAFHHGGQVAGKDVRQVIFFLRLIGKNKTHPSRRELTSNNHIAVMRDLSYHQASSSFSKSSR